MSQTVIFTYDAGLTLPKAYFFDRATADALGDVAGYAVTETAGGYSVAVPDEISGSPVTMRFDVDGVEEWTAFVWLTGVDGSVAIVGDKLGTLFTGITSLAQWL